MIFVRLLLMAAIAGVTTSISMRLLGMRRGWASSLMAVVLGWGTAIVLALALVKWSWEASGLVLLDRVPRGPASPWRRPSVWIFIGDPARSPWASGLG